MSYQKIDISKIPNPNIKKILEQLDHALRDFGVEFYMIGARARDLWLSAKNISPKRFTEDIDFAVLIDNMNRYEKLKSHLEQTGLFISVKVTHRGSIQPTGNS